MQDFVSTRNAVFPVVCRKPVDTVQANLGYRCNQSCSHCHVAAGSHRTEEMSWPTMAMTLEFAGRHHVKALDLTGGAPELNPNFRRMVQEATGMGLKVIDRCNLTILNEPGQETLAEFLAEQRVEINASLPCYLEENVNRQRGDGVFASSLTGLRKLNELGYGQPGSDRILNLVYNPGGPVLPPDQKELESAYREQLLARYGIVFNKLFVIANMPMQRFARQLVSRNQFDEYMALLKGAHREENLGSIMCRTMVSIDWRGDVFDCDFNQMLDMPLGAFGDGRRSIADLMNADLVGQSIRVSDHCYACTAGQGSSCGGALKSEGKA